MQSATSMPGVSLYEDLKRQLDRHGIKLRNGQDAFVKYVCEHFDQRIYLAVLCTGYGKSILAHLVCEILKRQGRANRFLYLVPTVTQLEQYAEDIGMDVQKMGLSLKLERRLAGNDVTYLAPTIVDGSSRIHRLNRQNEVEVYVATVQNLIRNEGFYQDLMSTGRWCVFCDEYQKLNLDEQAVWGQAVGKLNHTAMFGLTATTVRSDRKQTVFGSKKPDVEVTLEEAYKEKAIRGIRAHVEHYFVDIRGDDGVERVTTENINDYDLSKELRFTTKYQSSILSNAHGCLTHKNLKQPDQHQMLIFAMGVAHARSVSDLLNMMYGNGFSEWVGVGPNGQDRNVNSEIIRRYKDNKFQCLVQVDMAGEGFNNPRSSVLVFLNLLKKYTVKAAQQAGRGTRRNYGILDFEEDVCDMFASPDTEMAELIQDYAERTLNVSELGEDSGEPTGETKKSPIFTIPPFDSTIVNSEYDRSEIISNIPDSEVAEARETIFKKGGEDAVAVYDNDWIRRVLAEQKIEKLKEIEAAQKKPEAYRDKVKRAVGLLADNVVRVRYGISVPTAVRGDLIKTIHSTWIKYTKLNHSNMSDDNFRAKYEWIQKVNEELRSGGVPLWLQL